MEQLVEMQTVTQLTPRIVRILGGNPGKFTLQGTNTYLISPQPIQPTSSSTPCILVDTGEGRDVYISSLKNVLQGKDSQAGPSKRHISDIILTHRHHDHVGGLPSVLQLLSTLQSESPRLYKYPDAATDGGLVSSIKDLAFNKEEGGSDNPIRSLKEGDMISIGQGSGDENSDLQVIHSPGHTQDHICLFFQQERALLTGDHVLGQGTSVFEDLGAYLKSLKKCYDVLQENSPEEERILYPAHGPIIKTGKKALQEYLSHRLERENQILELLATTPSDGGGGGGGGGGGDAWTIKSIVSKLYSNYPEHLYPAAARGIFLHLRKLALPDQEAIDRGVVVSSENQGRRVTCIGRIAGKNGTAPETPNVDVDWIPIMELQWALLQPQGEGVTKESL